ncbi:hypothetical protein [Paenibacillus harenae]|uniref:Uncharacterized protein n=1 Tax=Paenibacillus harenae TaxID=306543 RepID=A0ABT9U6I7_PAEHA|nr:hypothetical protein [Paenibacillus harenae]MDQ0114310.1 hypothetical protein [Paenibacillus harenae]
MKLSWRKATLAQLREIAYNDPGASPADKASARNEYERKKKRRSGKPDKHVGSKR